MCVLTCPPLTTGSGEVDEDQKNPTTPLYVNVEMDDVPMITSPIYGKVELTMASDHNRAAYANL